MEEKYEKSLVGYRRGSGDEVCSNCAHYRDGACDLVDGSVRPNDTCELYMDAPKLRPPE